MNDFVKYPTPAKNKMNTTKGNTSQKTIAIKPKKRASKRTQAPEMMTKVRAIKPTIRINVFMTIAVKKPSASPLPLEILSLRHGENSVLNNKFIEK